MALGKRLRRKRKLTELKAEFKTRMEELNQVRGNIENLTDSPQGFTIYFDKKANAHKRGLAMGKIMIEGARITRAATPDGQLVQGRFAVAPIGTQGDFIGISLLYFSKEFGELEIEAVKARAKIIALEHNVGIEEIKMVNTPEQLGPEATKPRPMHPTVRSDFMREFTEAINSQMLLGGMNSAEARKALQEVQRLMEAGETEKLTELLASLQTKAPDGSIQNPERKPDTVLRLVDTVKTWEEVTAIAKEMYEKGEIHYLSAVNIKEIEQRGWAATKLMGFEFDMSPPLSDALKQLYPNFDRIEIYTNELRGPEGAIQKNLIVVYLKHGEDIYSRGNETL